MFCYDSEYISFFEEINNSEEQNFLNSLFSPKFNSVEEQNEKIIDHKEDIVINNINEGNSNNEIKNAKQHIYESENTLFSSNRINDLKFQFNIKNQNNKNNDLSYFSLTKKINNHIKSGKNNLLGRKKKYSNEAGEHDKFTADNLSRKCKCIILKNLYIFINRKIKLVYNIPNKDNKKQLLKINQRQIVSSKVDYNIKFLKKTLKDIFSENISSKFIKYYREHNKLLIQSLLNEEDEEKRKIFEKLFGLTFLDCLNHFRGSKYIKELEGMATLDEVCDTFIDEKDLESYKYQFKYFINNFENIIMNKKMRNRRKISR